SALNLCSETLDGVRNHSWKRPACLTPEGAVVSWADRVAYTCHDLEDAVKAGIVTPPMIPAAVTERCGPTRREQLRSLISSMVGHGLATGEVGMGEAEAEALDVLRAFNFERIYLRPASVAQARVVVEVLRALVEHFGDRPNLIASPPGREPQAQGVAAGSKEAVRAAVHYVAGMTDRFALRQARAHLGGSIERMAELGFER
ncbi:MAG: HD domain-containing protein, partial [Acidimicrobiia bacterium]